MLKYILILKICSSVMGGCYEVPKRVSYDTHYDCGLAGYSMAYSISNAEQIENLKQLCINILQPLRDYYELPIKITSGFRSEKLAALIGSKSTSQHCKGEAADFEIPGADNKEVASHIKNNFDFDQLILEYYDQSDINSGWIHCSFKTNGRKESLTKNTVGYYQWK
jgi:zinc D-Ala-D-Ala carboxypeptidase